MMISLETQARSLLESGLSVAKVSVLTGISRDRIRGLGKGIQKYPYQKSHRKALAIFKSLCLFTSLVRIGMSPCCAMNICDRNMVMTGIHYLFLYRRRKEDRATSERD